MYHETHGSRQEERDAAVFASHGFGCAKRNRSVTAAALNAGTFRRSETGSHRVTPPARPGANPTLSLQAAIACGLGPSSSAVAFQCTVMVAGRLLESFLPISALTPLISMSQTANGKPRQLCGLCAILAGLRQNRLKFTSRVAYLCQPEGG